MLLPIYYVEAVTGKGFKVTQNEYQLGLAPIVDTSGASNSKLMLCEEFNFRINPGDVIGHLRVDKEKPREIQWTNTNNVKSSDLIVYINNELEKNGYNVLGLGRNKNTKRNHSLKIEIEVIKADINISSGSVTNTSNLSLDGSTTKYKKSDLRIDMKWRIVNVKDGAILYEKLIPGYSVKYKEALQIVTYNAIKYSLATFLSDVDAKKVLNASNDFISSNLLDSDTATLFIKDVVNTSKISAAEKLKLAMQSVVTIETEDGTGSGFIISEDGYLVTNAHVVEQSKQVNVIFSNGYSFTADVIKVSTQKDLALLKVNGKGFKPLTLVSDSVADIGSDVYAIGAPIGKEYSQSITKGIISGYRIKSGHRYLQTDVSISPGNSGGPLLNKNYEVLGVVQSKLVGEGIEGIGFCIPIEEVISIFNIRYKK